MVTVMKIICTVHHLHTCHMPYVTCHMPHAACHMPHATCHMHTCSTCPTCTHAPPAHVRRSLPEPVDVFFIWHRPKLSHNAALPLDPAVRCLRWVPHFPGATPLGGADQPWKRRQLPSDWDGGQWIPAGEWVVENSQAALAPFD